MIDGEQHRKGEGVISYEYTYRTTEAGARAEAA